MSIMNGDLENSLSSFNASSCQIQMEEGRADDDGKEPEYVDIMGMAAPDGDYDYHYNDYSSMGRQSFGSFVVDESSRTKCHNSLDVDKSNYLYSDDCEIASNDGTNYSGWSDDFDDEPDIPAPDFGRGHNRRQPRRHSLDQSYGYFDSDQDIGPTCGFGYKQKSRSSFDDSNRSFDIDHDSEQNFVPHAVTTRTKNELTSISSSRRARMMESQAGYSQSLGATTQLLPSSVGTNVMDTPDDIDTDTTPPVYTARLRTASTRRMQRRGTMDTEHTVGTQGSDDFRTILSGDKDSDEEDNKQGFSGIFMAIKFSVSLLHRLKQNNEDDEIPDALASGKRNRHRDKSTEDMFLDSSPKTAPPPCNDIESQHKTRLNG